MEKKLYLGRISSWKNCLEEIQITKETEKRYTLGSNSAYRNILNKSDLNRNIESGIGFEMFSESKELLIELMREYVSKEIERANKRISDLQISFEKVLSEINTN